MSTPTACAALAAPEVSDLDAHPAWVTYMQSARESNRVRYRNVIADYFAFCGTTRSPECTRTAVEYLRALRDEKGNALETVRGKKGVLSRYFQAVHDKTLEVLIQPSSNPKSRDEIASSPPAPVLETPAAAKCAAAAATTIVVAATSEVLAPARQALLQDVLPHPISVSAMPDKLPLSTAAQSTVMASTVTSNPPPTTQSGGAAYIPALDTSAVLAIPSSQKHAPRLQSPDVGKCTAIATAAPRAVVESATSSVRSSSVSLPQQGTSVPSKAAINATAATGLRPETIALSINTASCKSLHITLESTEHVHLLITSEGSLGAKTVSAARKRLASDLVSAT